LFGTPSSQSAKRQDMLGTVWRPWPPWPSGYAYGGMYHVIYIMTICCESHNIVCLTSHTCNN